MHTVLTTPGIGLTGDRGIACVQHHPSCGVRNTLVAVVKAAGPLALRAVAREVGVKFPTRIVEAAFRRLSKLHMDEPLFALSGQLSPAGPTSPIHLTAPIWLTDQVQCCRNSLLHSAVKLLTESPGQALASGDLLSLDLDLLMREEHLPEAAPRLAAHVLSVFPRCCQVPRHLSSDAHEWINEIPTAPFYYLAKPQPRKRAWQNPRRKYTLVSLTLV
ncbi:unnamed protein product [Schistocephalus solidus]|uniref:Dihydropteroate synthase n=1 Tax=Schistocephalus solidus TaxID=70667 RepID=A0A183TNR6_SCHSO|nr:unnamed protein product [Schistocephalus solidus]